MPFGGSSPPLSVYVEIFVFLFFKINFTCVFASLQRSVFSSTNKNVVYCFNESFQFHWMLYLQVDGIRTELNYKTPTWFLESCLMRAWGGGVHMFGDKKCQKWSLLCEEQTDSQGRRNHKGRSGVVFILLPSTWDSTGRGHGGNLLREEKVSQFRNEHQCGWLCPHLGCRFLKSFVKFVKSVSLWGEGGSVPSCSFIFLTSLCSTFLSWYF